MDQFDLSLYSKETRTFLGESFTGYISIPIWITIMTKMRIFPYGRRLSQVDLVGGGRKRSVSHPGVTIWWPIYIFRGFSARPLNVK